MLGFTTQPFIPTPILILNSSISYILPLHSPIYPSIILKSQKAPRKLLVFAEKGKGDGLYTEVNEREKGQHGYNNDGGGNEELKNGDRNERPRFNLRWVDLLLDPDPDNILAVGLTGLLTWASVQVLWQLFIISLAILIAALKYSFIAAFLLIILITLL